MCENGDKADEIAALSEMLERVSLDAAAPAEDCAYPRCEECDKYHGHWCTVPMVVSKQILRLTADKLAVMENRLSELEKLVYDEILGE